MYVPAKKGSTVRRAARTVVWKCGDIVAGILSQIRDFRVPNEPLQPFLQKIPMLIGTYERETVNALSQLVSDGDTVIDGGAHAGYFTQILSGLVGPKGRVLAFEIHPQTLGLLRHNTRALTNVEIIPAALGPIDGTATLFESPGLSASHSATATKPGLLASAEIPMRSAVSVLAERGLSQANFLKLDIEGGEPAVLRSLPPGPVSIIFEVKRYILEPAGESPERLLLDLINSGFALRRVDGRAISREELATRSAEWDKANVVALRPAF